MSAKSELCLYSEHFHEGSWDEIDAQIEACRQRLRAETGLDRVSDIAMPVYERSPQAKEPELAC